MKLREVTTETRQDALFYKERAERFERQIAGLEAALAECELRCKKDHVPVATMKAMIDQIADLERKLAECEEQRTWLRGAALKPEAMDDYLAAKQKMAECEREKAKLRRDIEQGFMEGAYARLQNLQEAERKLTAAREALRDLLEVIEVDNLIPESVSYMRQARAALTEAGEGKRKELSFDKWTDVEPVLTDVEAGEGAEMPLDILLFCPHCGTQHIDAPDDRTPDWTNPPHKTHLCHECKHLFRPSDKPTNGVATIKSKSLVETGYFKELTEAGERG